MEWFDCSVPLRPPGGLDTKEFDAMEDMFFIQTEDEFFSEDWLNCYATEIFDAQYKWTDITDVVNKLTHLNANQKADLLGVLHENSKMFDGTLGIYPHQKIHIELLPGAKPMHLHPCMHSVTFNHQLDHLIKISALVPKQINEWASPSFIFPKKDGRVRWIGYLCQLNKVIKRRQYPLLMILDIL